MPVFSRFLRLPHRACWAIPCPALRHTLSAETNLAQVSLLGKKKGAAKGQTEQQQEGQAQDEPRDPEAKLLAEMAAARETAARREKKDRKKTREMKKKARIRCVVGRGGTPPSAACCASSWPCPHTSLYCRRHQGVWQPCHPLEASSRAYSRLK
jgi:hypothetical protein